MRKFHSFLAGILFFFLLGGLNQKDAGAAASSESQHFPRAQRKRTNAYPENKSDENAADSRVLGGHSFLRNSLIDYPFAAPYINASLEASRATISESGATQDIKSVGLSPSFTGQFCVADTIGIELGAQLAEVFGANSYSAFVLGANFDYAFSTGIRVAAIREENWAITPAVFYSWDKGVGFSPLGAADLAVSDPSQALTTNFLTKTSSHQLRPSLLGAWAPMPLLGFTGEIGLGLNASSLAPNSYRTIRLGISAELDLASALGIPIGTSLFYRDDMPWKVSMQSSPLLGAGLYEMVNKNFNFGAEISRLMKATSSLSALLTLTAYY